MGVILLLAIYANNYFSHQAIAIRLIGWIIDALVLASLFFYTGLGRRFWAFAQASRAELRKVVWPTRPEIVQAVLMVLVTVIVMSILLWIIDMLIFRAIGFITT